MRHHLLLGWEFFSLTTSTVCQNLTSSIPSVKQTALCRRQYQLYVIPHLNSKITVALFPPQLVVLLLLFRFKHTFLVSYNFSIYFHFLSSRAVIPVCLFFPIFLEWRDQYKLCVDSRSQDLVKWKEKRGFSLCSIPRPNGGKLKPLGPQQRRDQGVAYLLWDCPRASKQANAPVNLSPTNKEQCVWRPENVEKESLSNTPND